MSSPSITNVRFEQHHDGFGVNTSTPRISWSFADVDASSRNWQQEAYELYILVDGDGSAHQTEIAGEGSLLVPWPARPLKSRESASVQVRVRGRSCSWKDGEWRHDGDATQSDWSPVVRVEAALLLADDWTSQFITLTDDFPKEAEDGSLRPISFVKQGSLPAGKITRARLYITAHGVYQAHINGKPVGDQCMAPGWTSYKHRQYYQTFDVAELLRSDQKFDLNVEVGAGWYASALGWAGGRRCRFGSNLGLLAQLEVDFEGATTSFMVGTDESWQSSLNSIVRSEIYNGEVYDARLRAGSGKLSWYPVKVDKTPSAQLIPQEAPPVRVTEEKDIVDILKTPSGRTIIDFGQNLVGKLRINSLHKPRDHQIRFRHAEVLEHGEIGVRPLRFAASQYAVISNGDEIEGQSPCFTFHGFRYVEVDGWSPEDQECPLTKWSLTALVMHSDMKQTGWFRCSHKQVSQLHENVMWSMRGNFVSIPTDCPQRDERLGWTGDIQVFSPTASFLYDTSAMLGGWIQDVAAEQLADGDGIPPFVVPNVIGRDDEAVKDEWWPRVANAVWDDVVAILPWDLYQAFGDEAVLSKQYQSMQAWVDKGVKRGEDGLWESDKWQLGDWLDPAAPPSEPGFGKTDGVLVADAYLVRITWILANVARILGNHLDHTRYQDDWLRLKNRFQEKYITPAGLVVSDTQTAIALAIVFDLFATEKQRIFAGERLVRAVRFAQFRVTTGFAGTPIILRALSMVQRPQYAYRMLLEKRCPSWMYPVSMGATTIWERWDSMLPDGSINPGEMTSFNHYALGSVANWLHEDVGGISPLTPGWKQIKIRPIPGPALTWAQVRHDCPYGTIGASWTLQEDEFKLEIIVPPNTTACVVLPGHYTNSAEEYKEGTWVGSGRHTFTNQYRSRDTWPPTGIHPEFWPQPHAELI
ncbi:alfa-L-rhamnosidase [Truncatella angustata]|uniref:alpha-L-rhamnosidase n=1 Tax=Truncatella angustata TaxID=152316 RepID=A0A9P8UD65_9PEZI|nr:alfa-L-rhamnosidase [Truncatella angustata]KAH6647753.1 alfa-L-rhamnosidase [Truncatella angustata]